MRLRNLPRKLKISGCIAVCAALLSSSLMITGCSTPKNAVEFGDGTVYTTAEYIAHLYNAYYTTFNYYGLYQYAQYDMDPWGQELTYGEGDDAEKLKLEEYINTLTRDNLLRRKAIEDKMKEYGLTELSKEDQEDFKNSRIRYPTMSRSSRF